MWHASVVMTEHFFLQKDPNVEFRVSVLVDECSLLLVTTAEPVIKIKVALTAINDDNKNGGWQ